MLCRTWLGEASCVCNIRASAMTIVVHSRRSSTGARSCEITVDGSRSLRLPRKYNVTCHDLQRLLITDLLHWQTYYAVTQLSRSTARLLLSRAFKQAIYY